MSGQSGLLDATVSVPTIWGHAVTLAALYGIDYIPTENTTLNEAYNILAGVNLSTKPKPMYVTVGLGGTDSKTNPSGIDILLNVRHEVNHANLYKPTPWILREVNNDIPANVRVNYALRKKVNYNGIEYIAYYLKKLDAVGSDLTMKTQYYNHEEDTLTDYTPGTDILNPIKPEVLPETMNVLTTDSLRTSVGVSWSITDFDRDELINAANIVYGPLDVVRLTEFGLVTATPSEITADNITYTEAHMAQISNFNILDLALDILNGTTTIPITAGDAEPLVFGLTNT